MKHTFNMSTERLIIRQWCDEDLEPFAALNADCEVMRYFPSVLNRSESDQLASRIRTLIDQKGWGFWAVEEKVSQQFIGFVGLHLQELVGIPYTPMIEIGWRLHRNYWRYGYATEAAQLALKFAFEVLKVDAVYSFTALVNQKSQRVMQKLGMQNTGHDFEHPKLAANSVLKTHCLYKLSVHDWKQMHNL